MKECLKKAFLALNGDYILRTFNRQPRVLFWHGIDKRADANVEQEIFDIEVFEKQIHYLNKYYEIISIEEFERRLFSKEFSGKEVILTFDDGYANNLYIVAPILNKLRLPFTVFVSTEHIDNGTFFPTSVNRIITRGAELSKVEIPSQHLSFPLTTKEETDAATTQISRLLKSLPVAEVKKITEELIENVDSDTWDSLKQKYKSVRPMNWEEVKKLSGQGATIGSHCMWHTCCHGYQSKEDIREQIAESKKLIESHLNKPCRYFAYPNGDFTEYSNECVAQNYSLGFSTQGRQTISYDSPHATIPRISVVGNMDTFRILTNLYPSRQ